MSAVSVVWGRQRYYRVDPVRNVQRVTGEPISQETGVGLIELLHLIRR